MIKFLLRNSVVFLLLFSTLFASQKVTDNLAKISASSLYNIDTLVLSGTLKAYIKTNADIKAIEVIDSLSNEIFLTLYKDKNGLFFENSLPSNFSDLNVYRAPSIYQDEIVGEVIVYFSKNNNANSIQLTQEEKQYIKDNPLIRVGGQVDWAPFDFVDEHGNYQGFSKDFVELVISKTGLMPKYITGKTWKELLADFNSGELDVLPAMYKTKEREGYSIFTKPYYEVKDYVFVRNSDFSINSFEDLKDKRIAIIKGYAIENNLKQKFPDIKFVKIDSLQDGINAVLLNQADAYIDGYDVMMHAMSTQRLTGLKPVVLLDFYKNDLHIGINHQKKLLASIIKKSVNSISADEKKTLFNKWFLKETSVNNSPEYSVKEKAWLQKNNTIKLAYMNYWPKNAEGKNIHTEYINLLSRYGDLDISLKKFDEWKIGIEAATKGTDVHGILNLSWSKEREDESFDYVEAYYYTPIFLVVKKENNQIKTIEDLTNKSLFLKKGSITEKIVNQLEYNIDPIYLKDDLTMIKALSKKDTKVEAILTYIRDEELLKTYGLKVVDKIFNKYGEVYVGIAKKNKELASLLKKAHKKIPASELTAIQNKSYSIRKEVTLNLTSDEKKWIAKKIPLEYVYDANWVPFEWKNEVGNHTGIVFDFLTLIEERSGLKLKEVSTTDWHEAKALMESKQVDMVSGMGESEDGKKHYNFTKHSLFKTPYVFVSREDDTNDYLETFKAMRDKKVAVVQDYTIHELLKDKKIEYPLITLDTMQEGFEKLRSEEIDVLIVNAVSAKYFIKRLGFDDLKIATKTEFSLDLKISLQKEINPLVISILDKAIASITEKERSDIYFKWTEVLVEEKIDWDLVYKVSGGALFLVLVIFYWNRKLKMLVDLKTKELKKLLYSFDENVLASKTDTKGIITYASKAFCTISGYTEQELIGRPQSIVRHPDMPKELFKELWETILDGKVWKGEIKNKKKNGDFYWVDSLIEPIYEEDEIVGYSAIRHDITSKKEVEELSINLEKKVEERTEELEGQKHYVDSIMNSQSSIVISTDGNKLRTANKAFFDFFAVSNVEGFIEKYGDCICDTFDTTADDEFIQKMMGEEEWIEYVFARPDEIHKTIIERNNKKHIFAITSDSFEFAGEELKVAVFVDITEIEDIRKNIETILSNIMLPVLISSKKDRTILYANEYASKKFETTAENLIGLNIDNVYIRSNQEVDLIDILAKDGSIENLEEKYRTLTEQEFIGLLSVKPIVYNGEDAFIGMIVDISKQKEIEEEIRQIHEHTQSSIEYASLIQHTLIPEKELFSKYFKDHFTLWNPKDIVGGDIYLFEELRNENECLLMVIDCTGHGVPGAFVTMLVKAIERQITSKIINSNEEVSPAKILSVFNKSMKHLLKQEDTESVSNAGFDGGILYYNKREGFIKYAGAETPLFYTDSMNELKMIKGDRHSIGYKKSSVDFEFKEHVLEVEAGMQFYLTTDGYLDQNGGEKGFPFGKKRFKTVLNDNKDKPMDEQKKILLENLGAYQKTEERNDDIAIVGVKISH